jgi:glutamate/tyrosine decarboxylase-like PLP-dependent enzyme
VLAGLQHAFPEVAANGLRALESDPVFYASDQAHDSLVKIARVVGLGDRALHRVPSDQSQRLDVAALRTAIEADRELGRAPFLVAATAGTTATGAIDPLPELVSVCRDQGLWLHVDAAWGGIAALSETLRGYLAGIEHADSVTWDAHKTLPVPMGAGMLFSRSPQLARATYSVRPGYIPDHAPAAGDPLRETLQWSRRFIGLKVFLVIAELGSAGVAALVERQAEMAALLRERLVAAGWQLANDSPLPVVCFTRAELSSDQVGAIARAVTSEGRAWISDVQLSGGRRWLRACITHDQTDDADLEQVVAALERARRAC